jgi:PAS domain S-box-containing protein
LDNLDQTAGDVPPPDSDGQTTLDQLGCRPWRERDFQAECHILGVLVDELAERPGNLLQKMCDLLVEQGIGGSAGISLRDPVEEGGNFRWVALSGGWSHFKGNRMPFDTSPCGVVVREDAPLLIDDPLQYFAHADAGPMINELLLVPFHRGNTPVGTLWVASESGKPLFEREDLRLLKSVARFAAASHQITQALEDARADERQSKAALAAELADLKRLHELYARLAIETDLDNALKDILAAAVDFTGTDRGVMQRVSEDGKRLEFAAHHGFGEGTPFTEHFRYGGAQVACASPGQHHQRVIIEDIANFPALAGTIDREILLVEGIGATQSTPMISSTGKLIGVLNTQFRQPHRPLDRELRLIDMLAWTAAAFIERHSGANAALRESETRFRELGAASSDVIWIRDAASLAVEYLSPAFAAVYGAPSEHYLGTLPDAWLPLVHPDDRTKVQASHERIRSGERMRHEFRIIRPSDGMVRWVRNTDFPFSDASGRITRIGGIGQDVTEEKAADARLAVLVAELQHRTRNVMAVVQSLADSTLRGASSLDQFGAAYRVRLNALGRVQGLLSRLDTGDRVTFDELIRTELYAIGVVDEHGRGPNVELDGPNDIRLRSSTVQTLALALHELTTNAAKYGALAQPQARLRVRWRLDPAEDLGDPTLVVDWEESQVVMLAADEATRTPGFGRRLIERALPYELDAETHYTLGPDGVRCSLRLPVSTTVKPEELIHG